MTLIHGGRSISTDWVLASVRFILVAIVCLSTGIVLAGVVGAAGVADQGTGNPEAADTALDQDAADSAVGDVPDRLEGDVTAAPVVVDGQVVVGTDRGVYVVSDGSSRSSTIGSSRTYWGSISTLENGCGPPHTIGGSTTGSWGPSRVRYRPSMPWPSTMALRTSPWLPELL